MKIDIDYVVNHIVELCTEKGITIAEMLRDCGLNKSTVDSMKKGSQPTTDKLLTMSAYFGMSLEEFVTGKPFEKSNISDVLPDNDITMIPVYESVSAGTGTAAMNNVLRYIPLIIANPYYADKTFGIVVKGDSMEPKIEDGDIVIVQREPEIEHGKIGVVEVGDEGFVKLVTYGRGTMTLTSLNNAYKPIVIKGADLEDVTIVGQVVQVVKEL